MPTGDFPHGFVLSEAAQYAFLCQDVYPDIVSFSAAIPAHLKPLFLIPIKLDTITASYSSTAAKIAQDISPTGDSDESDLFGTKTFVYEDNQPTVPSSNPGSIFDIDGADNITHHQEYDYDMNLQAPSDTSYMSDVDIVQYFPYPYKTDKTQVRHSFDIRYAKSKYGCLSPDELKLFRQAAKNIPAIIIARIALKPEALIPRTPSKIKKNAASCVVKLASYNKKNRVFTFDVTGGSKPRTVQAYLSEIDHVALSCDCPFWRWNGPEYHAKSEDYMLGQPFGTATPPNVRDPDRQFFLCKHAYSVLKRLDDFVSEVVTENWDLDDQELLNQVDEEWDRLAMATKVPLEDLEKDDVQLTVDWTGVPGEDTEEDSEEDSTDTPEEAPEPNHEPSDTDPNHEVPNHEEETPDTHPDQDDSIEDYESPIDSEALDEDMKIDDYEMEEDVSDEPEAKKEPSEPEDYEVPEEDYEE